MTSPLSGALKRTSKLRAQMQRGLGALNDADRRRIDKDAKSEFSESLDLDEAMRPRYPLENRWDYLLGHEPSNRVVALEPHSATSGEVAVIIAKKERAKVHLRTELEPDAHVSQWFWVASGRVDFAPFEKAKLRLDQAGITFVGRTLQKKHLVRTASRGDVRET